MSKDLLGYVDDVFNSHELQVLVDYVSTQYLFTIISSVWSYHGKSRCIQFIRYRFFEVQIDFTNVTD